MTAEGSGSFKPEKQTCVGYRHIKERGTVRRMVRLPIAVVRKTPHDVTSQACPKSGPATSQELEIL